MPIVGLSFKLGERRLNQVLTNLRRLGSPDLLASADIESTAAKALKRLKANFPKSKAGSRNFTSLSETGLAHLREGWVSKTTFLKGGVGFVLQHVLGNKSRINTILKSLDKGSRAYSFVVERKFAILDRREKRAAGKQKFAILMPGDVIHHDARPGSNYTDETFEYVIDTLIPAMREKVRRKAKSIIEK